MFGIPNLITADSANGGENAMPRMERVFLLSARHPAGTHALAAAIETMKIY